jgi:hypothetical protein
MLVVGIAYRCSFCDWKRGDEGRNIATHEDEDAWAAGRLASGTQLQRFLGGRGDSFSRSLMFCNPNPVTHKRRVHSTGKGDTFSANSVKVGLQAYVLSDFHFIKDTNRSPWS